MTRFEVVEAKPFHVGRMIRAMRASEREAMVRIGLSPHHELAQVFGTSSFRRAWMIDGRLAALGGVTGTIASSEGFIWLVFAAEAARYPVEIVKECRRQMGEILASRTELTTTIIAEDETALRFARHMGFRPAGAERQGMRPMRLKRAAPILPPRVPRETPPFFVFGLPRSRTAWLTAFLSQGGARCRHDGLTEFASLAAMDRFLAAEGTGLAETGMAMAWPVLRKRYPGARFVVVERPIEQVRASLAAHDWNFAAGHLEWMAERLSEISALPGTLTVTYPDLDSPDACARIFEHCLGRPMPTEWLLGLAQRNIQIDMTARLQHLTQNGAAIQRFVDQLTDLMLPVTIQTEQWDELRHDAPGLIREHRTEVAAGLPFDPNYELAERADRIGCLALVTARAGRQLVGYLAFTIEESAENRSELRAIQNTFYVRPEFRGALGLRMMAAAREALAERGVAEIVLRAGVKGDGPRLASLFERMGAREDGRLYSLRIGDR